MDPLEPLPPRPAPPSPPRPELLAPPARAPATTPMMDFFQKRVEALERELAKERERANAASSLLTQQEALKNEVEGHLKGLSDQLRREKAEREGEEAKQHARGRVEALERRLDEMNATFAQLLKEAMSRQPPAAATPRAKDEIIAELEAEKAELLKAMRERQSQLRAVLEERRAIEKTMGDSLVELMRASAGEAEKVRLQVAERAAEGERWHERLLELQRKVEVESARAGQEASSASDLRAKVATLSDHMARTLQERDAVVARFADWERERQRLLDALKQKDGMVAMLSSAFQASLKKP